MALNLIRETDEKLEWCSNPPRPPCAAYVENDIFIKLYVHIFSYITLSLFITQQICGDNGSCILKRCVALCVAYDSSYTYSITPCFLLFFFLFYI